MEHRTRIILFICLRLYERKARKPHDGLCCQMRLMEAQPVLLVDSMAAVPILRERSRKDICRTEVLPYVQEVPVTRSAAPFRELAPLFAWCLSGGLCNRILLKSDRSL